MFTAARLAFADLFSPRFRSVMFRSLALTIAFLVAIWIVVQGMIAWAIDIDSYPWVELLLTILTGAGLLVGLAFLIGPVASIFAGLFTDQIAGELEAVHYPFDPPGRELSTWESLRDALGFAMVVILVNLIALLLIWIPFVGVGAFFVGNGYLLGREFFEAVARRYLSRDGVRAARSANQLKVFVAGVGIAGFMVIPFLNLLTPLFATAFMLHLYKLTVRPVPREWLDFELGTTN